MVYNYPVVKKEAITEYLNEPVAGRVDITTGPEETKIKDGFQIEAEKQRVKNVIESGNATEEDYVAAGLLQIRF